MHELSIVRSLMEIVEKQAVALGSQRVARIQVKLNPLSGFDSDDVEFSFNIVKKEKPLFSDTTLVLNVSQSFVRCQKCGNEFEVEELPNICNQCDSMNLVSKEPTELILESYEIEK